MGSGGNIELDAASFSSDESQINATSTSRNGGNVIVKSDHLQLLNESQISASAGGEGDGGNILSFLFAVS